MTRSPYRVKRALTAFEMNYVSRAITEAATPHEAMADGLRAVYEVLLADVGESWDDPRYQEPKSLNPTLYAIPETQAAQLIELLIGRTDVAPEDKGILGLSWVNTSPSTYEG